MKKLCKCYCTPQRQKNTLEGGTLMAVWSMWETHWELNSEESLDNIYSNKEGRFTEKAVLFYS